MVGGSTRLRRYAELPPQPSSDETAAAAMASIGHLRLGRAGLLRPLAAGTCAAEDASRPSRRLDGA